MILLSRENVFNSVRLKHWTKDTRDIIAADTIIMNEVDPFVYIVRISCMPAQLLA